VAPSIPIHVPEYSSPTDSATAGTTHSASTPSYVAPVATSPDQFVLSTPFSVFPSDGWLADGWLADGWLADGWLPDR
jgi:hypothetical protein